MDLIHINKIPGKSTLTGMTMDTREASKPGSFCQTFCCDKAFTLQTAAFYLRCCEEHKLRILLFYSVSFIRHEEVTIHQALLHFYLSLST